MIIILLAFLFWLASLISHLPPLDSKPESLEAHKIKTAFFTHPTLTEIGRRLVSHYFLLTEEELAMWEEDPESFGIYTTPDTKAKSKCLRLVDLTVMFFSSPLKAAKCSHFCFLQRGSWIFMQTS